jgi:heme-degrading monooxygenase HmoA
MKGHLRPELPPRLSKVSRMSGGSIPCRHVVGEEMEFITMILWGSIEAVRALMAEDDERALTPEERKKYLQRFEQRAAHFEVQAER